MPKGLVGAMALACSLMMWPGATLAEDRAGSGAQRGSEDLWWLQHHHGARPGAPGQYYAGRHYGDGWRYRGYGVGAALATGAILGGALATQQGYYDAPAEGYYDAAPPEADTADSDYCFRTYRSYDPGSGTYLGYDGYRHPCP